MDPAAGNPGTGTALSTGRPATCSSPGTEAACSAWGRRGRVGEDRGEQAIKGILLGRSRGDDLPGAQQVMRPLRRMEEGGVSVTVVPAGPGGAWMGPVAAASGKTPGWSPSSTVEVTGPPPPKIARAARRAGAFTRWTPPERGRSPSPSRLPADMLAATDQGPPGPAGNGVFPSGKAYRSAAGGDGQPSESDHQPDVPGRLRPAPRTAGVRDSPFAAWLLPGGWRPCAGRKGAAP